MDILCGLLLSFSIVTSSGLAMLSQTFVSVSGRVIDERGKPMAKAVASLQSLPCPDCTDQIIPVYKTQDSGRFAVSTDIFSPKDLRLFIEEKAPDGYWDPIYPAHLRLSRIARFRGLKLTIPASGVIKIGDVQPTVRYKKIRIPLADLTGPRQISDTEFAETAKLTIRYGRLKIIENIEIDPKAYKEDSIFLALPSGKWTLIFSFQTDSRTKSLKIQV